MTLDRSEAHYQSLLSEFLRQPRETAWLEFKENNADPEEIGEYISALSNAAALEGKAHAYLIWGVRDSDRAVVGTELDPFVLKKGNEELENWLLRLLNPRPHFRFVTLLRDGMRVVVLEIPRATHRPVQFHGYEHIRIGSYKKPLRDFPEQERSLWRIFDQTPFEDQTAATNVPGDEVLALLDGIKALEMLGIPVPESRQSILERLVAEALIRRSDAGGYDILNLGAILFAKELRNFRHLARKRVRLIQYSGDGRVQTLREVPNVEGHPSGYALAFEDTLRSVDLLLPRSEEIGRAFRQEVPRFPPLALRELLANALIHQDFTVTGAGPMVEIFDSRVEITNPGVPLVSTDRFLDSPPRSRNEGLASMLRRMNICEERGTGIDKVVFQIELYQLPAPLFQAWENATTTTLFAPQTLQQMSREDRLRACYLHACLQHVTHQPMNNSTLRKRLAVDDRNKSIVSRLLSEAVEAKLIKLRNPEGESKKMTSYLPNWA